MSKKLYTDGFYEARTDSLMSAKHIVPLIMDMVNPKSVIDIGCGTGAFLSVFKKNGVNKILGLDGDWVSKDNLVISPENFKAFDLTQPFRWNEKFDLVVSLEVAEHLTEESAENFIKTLTNAGSIVLFSAAIPLQGGVNHLNEQWPEYWVDLFEKERFICVDAVRKRIWNNKEVSYWYAQNTFLFAPMEYINQNQLLKDDLKMTQKSFLSIVHPQAFAGKAQLDDLSYLPSFIRWFVLKLNGFFYRFDGLILRLKRY